jgi:hypothetical protein
VFKTKRRGVGSYAKWEACLKIGQFTLTVGSEPTHGLRLYQGRTFVIVGAEGFRVEFHRGPDGAVDELIFHAPNGTFAPRLVAKSRD